MGLPFRERLVEDVVARQHAVVHLGAHGHEAEALVLDQRARMIQRAGVDGHRSTPSRPQPVRIAHCSSQLPRPRPMASGTRPK
jgi:hypothetical protein